MPHDQSAFQFWRSVAGRLFLIFLIGWLTIVWFQGCLAPQARDEILQEQQNAAGQQAPH
jgi:hypothetical protein